LIKVSGVSQGKDSSRTLGSQSHVAKGPGQVALSITGQHPNSARLPTVVKVSRIGELKSTMIPHETTGIGELKSTKIPPSNRVGELKSTKILPLKSRIGEPKGTKISQRKTVQRDNETCPSLAQEVALKLLISSETAGLGTNKSIGKPWSCKKGGEGPE